MILYVFQIYSIISIPSQIDIVKGQTEKFKTVFPFTLNIFEKNKIIEHESIFQELIAEEAMMLQEFQKNIVSEGEISMMVFNGAFTHAVLKTAKPGDFRVQDDFGGTVQKYTPNQEQIVFAQSIVKAAPELPVYARVDIFRDNEGNWALAELEIFEPELWFRLDPTAANTLAKTIKAKFFS